MTEQKHKSAAIADIVFLGRAVERLSVLIAEQSAIVFKDMGIIIPVRSCSLMTVLANLQKASVSDLAAELGQSHQLIMQKIPKLQRLGLISHEQDQYDARRKLFCVTQEGTHQLEKFEQCRILLHTAYEGLFAEVGDINKLVGLTANALKEKTLDQRIKEGS